MLELNKVILSGDISKSLLQNSPKGDKKNEESIILINVPKYKINFCNIDSILKLKELKEFIKGTNNKAFLEDDSINNYLNYPSILKISSLIQKIFSIFKVKSINEIFFLSKAFNDIYAKEKNKELSFNSNNDLLKKNFVFF